MCRKFGEENKRYFILTTKKRKKCRKLLNGKGTALLCLFLAQLFQSTIIKWYC